MTSEILKSVQNKKRGMRNPFNSILAQTGVSVHSFNNLFHSKIDHKSEVVMVFMNMNKHATCKCTTTNLTRTIFTFICIAFALFRLLEVRTIHLLTDITRLTSIHESYSQRQ